MGSRHRRHAALAVAAALAGCTAAKRDTTLRNKKDGPSGGRVQLTWVVSPPSVKDPTYEEVLLRPLTLEITINGATQVLKLAPQLGALYPYNQVECNTDAYPLSKTEVAKITFFEGGAGGYALKRELDDTLVLVDWTQSDGACDGPDGAMSCPVKEKIVTTYTIPPYATVTQAIVEADAKGTREPFSCAAS